MHEYAYVRIHYILSPSLFSSNGVCLLKYQKDCFLKNQSDWLALKKKEMLLFTTTWIEPEQQTAKWNQSQKDKYIWFFLYDVSGIAELTEAENRMVVAKGCGEGKMGKCC